jgi:hypothetical protein
VRNSWLSASPLPEKNWERAVEDFAGLTTNVILYQFICKIATNSASALALTEF